MATVPGDEFWWDGFGAPITDGYVVTAAEFQGSLVIAGQFSRIGDVQVNSIARWDGSQWVPLGKGVEQGGVVTLTIDHGDLVAAGYFTYAGGIEANGIARWNGSDWSAIGTGFQDETGHSASVFALGSYKGALIAAVERPQANFALPSRSEVSRWDGFEWQSLGPSADGRISALAAQDDQLFAGGNFDSIGGVPAACVARWDGSTWSEVGGGVGLSWGPAGVYALSLRSGQLFAGGVFNSAGGIPVGNVAIWDGTTWQQAGSSVLDGVSAFAVQRDTLFAGCGNAIARWNGQDWDFPAPPLAGTPGSLVPHGDDLVVVGSIAAFNSGDDHPVALSVARLSTGNWEATDGLTERMHGLVGYGGDGADILSMVAYRGHIVAAGSFRYAGAPPNWIEVRDLAEWDGSRWTQFSPPPGTGQIVNLLAQGDTLYASGSFLSQPFGGDPRYSYTPVYRYDGTQWTALGEGPPSNVMTIALYQGDLYEAEASIDALNPETRIRRWTGTGWDVIGTALGSTFPTVMALAEHEGKLVAAGRFLTMNGVPAANIAEWDGVAWTQVGPGFPGTSYYSEAIARDLCVVKGQLIVAGEAVALNLGGSPVAQWSGRDWEPLGGPIGEAWRLHDVAGDLFVSGNLHEPGDYSSSNSLARWNGHIWGQVGSGTNGAVLAMAALGEAVYMGGHFSEAGGKASYAIARWDGSRAAPGAPSFQAPRPNPFRWSTSLPYTVPATGMVRIAVYDVRGRAIALIEEGVRTAGPHTATWDGRDDSGCRSPSGIYFIRATMPGGERSRKIVLLR